MAGFDPVILPGGEGKVTASIRTDRYSGTITKSVTIYSNDPNKQRATVRLRGTILVPIEVRPGERINLTGRAGEIGPREILLVSRNGEPFDILEMSKSSEHLRVSLEPAPGEAKARADGSKAPAREPAEGARAGGHAAYKVILTVSEAVPIGRLSDVVWMRTSHPEAPRIQIMINGRIDGDVLVRPQVLHFPRPKPEEPAQKRELHLSGRTGGGLEILGVESTDPAFVPSVHVVSEGREYRIDVARPKAQAHNPGEVVLRVRTSAGVVEVPVYAR